MKYLLLLFTAATAYADSWFLAPSAALVFPSSSGIVYHGYSGSVNYRTGYAQGLQFGRNIGQFKLYVEYQHENFKARDITLNTPFGKVSQADSDNQDQHFISANCDYLFPKLAGGFRPMGGLGFGASFDETVTPNVEARVGLEKSFGQWDFNISYAYRFAQGSQRFGHKSNGSSSIVVERPDQQMLTISIGKNF